ncbi:MAG: DUF4349 domain-containing protein [Lachnospiraceae bacterium]|nr:DUF4349 domain-containing protein [Lachnospiraceae bacterium]
MKRREIGIAASILLLAAFITGCGSAGYDTVKNDTAYDNGSYYTGAAYSSVVTEEAFEAEYESGGNANAAGAEMPNENVQQSQRKLIKTVDLSVETESYDTLVAGLESQIAELGGYIEYQYQYNGSGYSNYEETRYANMQVRIPVNRLEEFIVRVGEQSNITNKEERVEDVTLRYVDLESHKKALLTEQDRLLDLLTVAETVEDIITIEQRLSDVRYQLESMESQLRTLDNQIDYSTINLSIREVKRLTPTQEKTVWDKIKNGFSESIYNVGHGLVNFFIWFVVNIPYIVIWAVVLFVAFLIIKAIIKKKKLRKSSDKKSQKEEGKHINGTDAATGTSTGAENGESTK